MVIQVGYILYYIIHFLPKAILATTIDNIIGTYDDIEKKIRKSA